jgi:hypothetical protein
MAISFHTPCVQPPDLWDTFSLVKGGWGGFESIEKM